MTHLLLATDQRQRQCPHLQSLEAQVVVVVVVVPVPVVDVPMPELWIRQGVYTWLPQCVQATVGWSQ